MNWLDRLERRYGDWAIPQFALFIVAANASIYFLGQIEPAFYFRLLLDPDAVLHHGEVWRLITFLFVPPRMGLLGILFWLLLLYQYGSSLENEWGDFRFCVFYAIGALATIVSALWIVGDTVSNIPLNSTLFLAFATLFPDFELLLFFILPVKVKYLAWLMWLGFAWSFIAGSFATRITLLAALVNYAVFFGPRHWETLKLKWEVYRNRNRFRGN